MDRRPAIPVAAEQDTTRIRIGPDGERIEEVEMIFTEYDAGRIRAGYCCIECGEVQERPFPERCYICAFPMRDDQARVFGEQFGGYTHIGPLRSIEELRAEDEEKKARARYLREKPTSTIWIP